MSSVLFDAPGPRARKRHLLYGMLFSLLLLVLVGWVAKRFYDEGVLTSEVFNATFQNRNIRYMWEGLQGTLKAAVLGVLASVVFGAVFAVGRLSTHRWISLPCAVVVEVFRAVPLVLLILAVWFAWKETLGTLGSLVVGLMLYNGSVLSEVFRAGMNAVPKGQSEAAYALGLRKTQVTNLILMPQAVRIMLPTIVSQCVIVLKDTSLGYLIIYQELIRHARQLALSVPNGTILVYLTTAAVFITLNYSLSKLAQYLERRLARRPGTGPRLGGRRRGRAGTPSQT
jgi:glutamate transport system permease protein